jgi:hypothetical protein
MRKDKKKLFAAPRDARSKTSSNFPRWQEFFSKKKRSKPAASAKCCRGSSL